MPGGVGGEEPQGSPLSRSTGFIFIVESVNRGQGVKLSGNWRRFLHAIWYRVWPYVRTARQYKVLHNIITIIGRPGRLAPVQCPDVAGGDCRIRGRGIPASGAQTQHS